MNELKFYFENIITFNTSIELRVFSKKPWEYEGKTYNFFSKFADNYQEMFDLLKKYYSNKELNMYCGINPRNGHGRKITDVSCIKNIVFDIEGFVKKPLADLEYTTRLNNSILYLEDKLSQYGLKFNLIVSSGRGVHAYCTFKDCIKIKYRHIIKTWFNFIVDDFNSNNPYGSNNCEDETKRIKIDKQVSDIARILGVPGTFNTKYLEDTAKRMFLVMKEELNSSDKIINIIKKAEELKKVNHKYKDKKIKAHKKQYDITEKKIFYVPEVRILLDYDNVPEGNRYTHIILPIKLLMRDNHLSNYDEVVNAVEGNGYKNPKIDNDFPEENEFESYEYSTSIFRKWCFMNWRWCVDNKYEIPYSYNSKKYYGRDKNNKLQVLPFITSKIHYVEYANKIITEWEELIDVQKEFNKKNTVINDKYVLYDINNFDKFIEQYLSDKLKEFIVLNKLKEYLMMVH